MDYINLRAGNPAIPISEDKPKALAANTGAEAADPAYRAKATDAAVKFEGFFIARMLHQMRSTTRELAGEDSIFKNSINSDMLDMADTMVADKMAGQRAFGIADAILRQLLPAQVQGPAVIQAPAAAADVSRQTENGPQLPEAG